ncbi:fibroblast growth factor receptor-like 1 isoform X1 [Euwallacea fornicatus]|uniref:fibroblast growth factor receptor-like 1 isoform X1 n=2 Tax=Euwallacea fornicatus TaxID=995702 RepID=UPI003390058D
MVVWQGLMRYCFLYFLTIRCQADDLLDTEGYSNDSPFNLEPKMKSFRVTEGTQYTFRCATNATSHIIWEYKECSKTYVKGFDCDRQDWTIINSNENWKKRSNKHRFVIESLKKNQSGLYRCIEKGIVRKVFMIEVVAGNSYEGEAPSVQSLLTSNITGQLNMEFTIQCNVTSITPPTIIWFKKCYGSKCDVEYEEICYCHLNIETSWYNLGITYISKMNIFNARDLDSGLYACLAVTQYGQDVKNVTIIVPDTDLKNGGGNSITFLFLIPLTLVVAPLIVWLCYMRRKKKNIMIEVQKHQVVLKASTAKAGRSTERCPVVDV